MEWDATGWAALRFHSHFLLTLLLHTSAATAGKALLKLFSPEKSRPQLRYGPEAGDALAFRRVTALVYGEAPAGQVSAAQLRADVKGSCWEEKKDDDGNPAHMVTFDRNPAVFADVGGREVWKMLLKQLNT